MSVANVIGLLIFALGVVLLILGLAGIPISTPLTSTDPIAFWLTVAGLASVGVGIFLVLKSSAKP